MEYTSYVEADYEKRVPLDKYKKLKRMEDMILGLSGKENLKVYVVCSGVLYGEGELYLKIYLKLLGYNSQQNYLIWVKEII